MPGQTTPKVTVTRVAVARSRELTAAGVRRVRAAAQADGAAELGFAVVAALLVLALAAVLAKGRRRAAGGVLLLLLVAACGRSAGPPPEVQVSVATEQVRLKPTQYCQDGQLRTYDIQPPVIAAPPGTRITLTVPAAVAQRGWSVQVFDDQLKQQLAEVPVAAGQAVLDQITTSDPAPPGFYLVVVEKKTASCSSLAGAWPVGFLRSGG